MTQLTFKTAKRLENLKELDNSGKDCHNDIEEIINFKNELKEIDKDSYDDDTFRDRIRKLIQEIEQVENDKR